MDPRGQRGRRSCSIGHRFLKNSLNYPPIIYHSIELIELSNFCEDMPWLSMMVNKLYPKNRKIMQILKMSVHENFLLEPMNFLYKNDVRIMYYSFTLNLEPNGTKSDKVPYGCGPLWARYPLSRGYYSCYIPFESPFRDMYHAKDRMKNGSVRIKL